MKPCLDSYHTNFNAFPDMLAYHEQLRQDSHWERSEVQNLTVAALDKTSPLFADATRFDASVSEEAILDTAENLGLAIQIGGQFYPLRDTSYRSLCTEDSAVTMISQKYIHVNHCYPALENSVGLSIEAPQRICSKS